MNFSNITDALTSPWIWGPVIAVIVIMAIIRLISRNWVIAGTDEVVILNGAGKQRILENGGAALKIPGFQKESRMSLRPFSVKVSLNDVITKENVPINVEAVASVVFGGGEGLLQTAIRRWASAPADEYKAHVQGAIDGSVRDVVTSMTVEALNGDRKAFSSNVNDSVAQELARLGMSLDTLKIQKLTDNDGYLEALGKERIAKQISDADIGVAEAARRSREQVAAANRAAAVAEAEAATQISDAERKRDIQMAANTALVDAEQKKASQAGPLAEAQAMKAVGVAKAEAAAASEEAQIAVEKQRAARAAEAQQADVIIPAEAKRREAIIEAEGQRAAAVEAAQGTAEATRLTGQADADKRIFLADAEQRELTARAEGRKAELLAEADGIGARLRAEAEGQEVLAKSLNTYDPTAAQLSVMPQALQALVQLVTASSQQVAGIEGITIIGGTDTAKGGVESLLGFTPNNLAAMVQTLQATTGIDLGSMFQQTPAPTVHPQDTVVSDGNVVSESHSDEGFSQDTQI